GPAGPDAAEKVGQRQTAPSQEEAYARLHALLAEAQDTGKAGALFDASDLLAAISDGQFSDFVGAIKRGVAESTNGLHVDLTLLKKARSQGLKHMSRSNRSRHGTAAVSAAEKPVIMISNRQLSDLRAEAVHTLQGNNEPPVVFQRQRDLVRFRMDAMHEPFLE